MDEPGEITLEKKLPYPPERVWDALTQADLVAQWWAPSDISPEVGHVFQMDMGQFGKQTCIVIAAEEPEAFSYVFGADTLDTAVAWTIETLDEGDTKLTLHHTGFDIETPMGMQAYQGMSHGWPQILDRLESFLAAAN